MRATASLWKKELVESRWFLYAGLVAFVVLPGLNALWSFNSCGIRGAVPDHFLATVLGIGAVYAGLVGAACGSRDTRGGLWWFARSRPIGLARWLAAKYLTGLVIALGPIVLALVIQKLIDGSLRPLHPFWAKSPTLAALLAHTLTLLAIYSAGFAAGSLTRQPVNAVILTAIFALSLYFLPVLIPPLAPLNVLELLEHPSFAWLESDRWRQLSSSVTDADDRSHVASLRLGVGVLVVPRVFLPFAGAMLVISATMASTGLLGLWRDWSVTLGRQAMAWTLGAVALLMFSVSAFQLGTNLTPESVTPLTHAADKSYVPLALKMRGERGAIAAVPWPGRPYSPAGPGPLMVAPLQLDRPIVHQAWQDAGVELIPALPKPEFMTLHDTDASVGYLLLNDADPFQRQGIRRLWLRVVDTKDRMPERAATIDLTHHLQMIDPKGWNSFGLACLGDRLYVYWQAVGLNRLGSHSQILTFDVSDATSPRLIRSQEVLQLSAGWSVDRGAPSDQFVPLPPLSDLSPRERLDVFAKLTSWGPSRTKGNLAVTIDSEYGMRVFRLKDLDQTHATFELAGRYEPTPLDRLFGARTMNTVLDGNYLYVLTHTLHSGVTVYDLRDPAHPRRAWHYAVPDDSLTALAATGDGRVVAVGTKVHVLRVPTDK
jgi:hypothetical protein